jgi:hypothetical protein
MISGIAGGVVQSQYFQIKFGVRPVNGPANQTRIDDVSSNVVSVLQAGAFFGALASAPVSGGCRFQVPRLCRLSLVPYCRCLGRCCDWNVLANLFGVVVCLRR